MRTVLILIGVLLFVGGIAAIVRPRASFVSEHSTPTAASMLDERVAGPRNTRAYGYASASLGIFVIIAAIYTKHLLVPKPHGQPAPSGDG